jgi:hypothetical protein
VGWVFYYFNADNLFVALVYLPLVHFLIRALTEHKKIFIYAIIFLVFVLIFAGILYK